MLKTLESLYDSYLEVENNILDKIEDLYDSSEENADASSDEISQYFENYFDNNSKQLQHDPILEQLKKLDRDYQSLLNSNEEIDKQLIYIATSIGHLNELITKSLCKRYAIDIYGKNTQASRINALKQHLSIVIINDLYFINSFRNSILHHGDYDLNLSDIDIFTKNKLYSEAKTAIVKFKYIYNNTKQITHIQRKR